MIELKLPFRLADPESGHPFTHILLPLTKKALVSGATRNGHNGKI
jgi:hypothetical protein